MTTMQDILKADLAATALDLTAAGTPAESLVYRPSGGTARTIAGLVQRQPAASLDGAPHGTAPRLSVRVLNDAATGIASTEINLGKDKLDVAVRAGQTAQTRLITAILSHNAATLLVEVR